MTLRAEIRSVQSQLKTAIHNHQMIVFKLKDRPVSIKLRVQMCNIQRHIVSLGEQQKKLLTQLRKELEANGGGIKAEMKPVIQPLQNLRPNPLNTLVSSKPITIKQEPGSKPSSPEVDDNYPEPVKSEVVPHTSRRKSKLVATPDLSAQNGHDHSATPSTSPSQKENTPSSTPSSSPTHIVNANKSQKQSFSRTPKREIVPPSSTSDESQDAYIHLPADPELRKKLQFMTALSLVTREVLLELQNRRTERKRRSTANPQYLYGNSADPKRKKPLYLASSAAGIVPIGDGKSSPKNRSKPQPALVCFSCSSATGSICQCSSCSKAFHWKCVSDSATPIPQGEALKCPSCLPTPSVNCNE